MSQKFRLSQSELAEIRESVRSGKSVSFSAAMHRELMEAARLGDAYPFRKEKAGSNQP